MPKKLSCKLSVLTHAGDPWVKLRGLLGPSNVLAHIMFLKEFWKSPCCCCEPYTCCEPPIHRTIVQEGSNGSVKGNPWSSCPIEKETKPSASPINWDGHPAWGRSQPSSRTSIFGSAGELVEKCASTCSPRRVTWSMTWKKKTVTVQYFVNERTDLDCPYQKVDYVVIGK